MGILIQYVKAGVNMVCERGVQGYYLKGCIYCVAEGSNWKNAFTIYGGVGARDRDIPFIVSPSGVEGRLSRHPGGNMRAGDEGASRPEFSLSSL